MLPMLTECLQKLKAAQVPLKEVRLPRCMLCTAPANPYGTSCCPSPLQTYTPTGFSTYHPVHLRVKAEPTTS